MTNIEPTTDEVLFYGYKEPLRKFTEGHGYIGVLSYSKDRDKIQCHFCGKLFSALTYQHLQTHGLDAKGYKEKLQLAPTSALIGEGVRQKMLLRPRPTNHNFNLKKAQDKRRQLIKAGKNPQIGRRTSLEEKNKKGICPDQLLDMIDKTRKSYGRVPTREEFVKFHHGKFIGSIQGTFGSWTAALAKLNLRTTAGFKHTEESLLESIKNFYTINKRSPRWSDFNRGLLPDSRQYITRFRSLNNARLLADVPMILNYGNHISPTEYRPSRAERTRILRTHHERN